MMQKEYLHIPLYAWLAGVGALLLSVLYFAKHKSTSSTTASGTNPMQSASPSSPQNIYYDTNVYNQPSANPGSTQAGPPPVGKLAPPAVGQSAPNPNRNPPSLPVYGPIIPPPANRAGYGGAVGGGAMLPIHPINPATWRPAMNSSIFGPAADGTSPVAPVIAWDMTPTAAYTQA